MINRRQGRILPLAYQRGSITAGSLRRVFNVSAETTRRDLAGLVALGLLEKRGKGRGTYYRPPEGVRDDVEGAS